jgi:MFS transporter, DHA2 family, methylenomycin A resistance protein
MPIDHVVDDSTFTARSGGAAPNSIGHAVPTASEASSDRLRAGRRRAIIGVNLASFALIFESSALTVALPELAREWRASMGTIQWVADASLLTTALLLLFAGRLSDENGTRRVMRLGLMGTAACAIAASLAPGAGWLIAFRLIQGACAALVVPGTLGLLRLFIPEDEERLRAMTWWSAISIAGSGAGPIAGGLSVDANAWRAIFALPALMSMVAWWCLRQRKGDAPLQSHCERRADRHEPGRAQAAALDHSQREGPRRGERAGQGGGGARALNWRGLLPIGLLKDRAFLASNLASGSMYFAVYGLSFALATKLPTSLSSSSLQTGLYMTVPAVMMLALASPVARISTGERGWWFAAIGASFCAMGLFALGATAEQATPVTLVAITALVGVGFAFALGPLDALMMVRTSPEDSNAASAFGHVTARVAGFSAIALGGAISASASVALVGAALAGLMAVSPRSAAAQPQLRDQNHRILSDR